MKYTYIFSLLVTLLLSNSLLAVDLKSCQNMNCRDLKLYPSKDSQNQCLYAKRDCHKKFVDARITQLKKSGITKAQRDKMTRALKSAKLRSEATLKALKAKVMITQKDLADLDQKIKEVTSLPAKK